MKHIFLIIFFLLNCASVFSQQDTSEIVQLILPPQTKQLNQSQIKAFYKKRSNFNRIDGNHIYQKDGLLLYYRSLSFPPDMPGYPSNIMTLEDIEKDARVYSKPTDIDTSIIIISIKANLS